MLRAIRRRHLLDEAARVLRFGLAGAVNTLVGGLIILLLQWGCDMGPYIANAGGLAAGIVCGFMLNKIFVFSAGNSNVPYLRYALTIAAAFASSELIIVAAHTVFVQGGGRPILTQVSAMAAYTTANFLLCRFWVFSEG